MYVWCASIAELIVCMFLKEYSQLEVNVLSCIFKYKGIET